MGRGEGPYLTPDLQLPHIDFGSSWTFRTQDIKQKPCIAVHILGVLSPPTLHFFTNIAKIY